ncbi:MAG: trypsin-like peptidase domain-containing protein [Planctomycetaceae bacterium]|nr:trypsin-like peptidase domain-containing protein [Planctomycetaceae bacterium]
MARRTSSPLLCTAMLSLGLALGGHLGRIPLLATASAVPDMTRPEQISPEAAALIGAGQHISRVAEMAMPAAVHIQAVRVENGRRVEETGSGVLVRSQQVRGLFVISNNHVIRGANLSDIDIRLSNGELVNPSRVYLDSESDLSVMQVRDGREAGAVWGDSSAVEIGHFVVAVGSPFGLSQSVTMGIVSAKGRRDLSLTDDRSVTNQDFIQTDAAINPGNSGGPLIDMHGRVIGINTAIASNSGGSEGIGFSIPSNLVRRVFEQLVTHGRVRRAYLGVELDSNFDDAAARRLGLPRAIGARITQVKDMRRPTPASVAGLRPDDVILKYNGVDVADENHLINLVAVTDIGASVQLEVFRGSRSTTVALQLTDRDDYRTAEDAARSFGTR